MRAAGEADGAGGRVRARHFDRPETALVEAAVAPPPPPPPRQDGLGTRTSLSESSQVFQPW